jgi:hypothetical protein
MTSPIDQFLIEPTLTTHRAGDGIGVQSGRVCSTRVAMAKPPG